MIDEYIDADDPVVATLDVEVVHNLNGFLHVLSYPLKPYYRPPEMPSAAKMRPKRRVLVTETQLDVHSPNFDSRAANDPRMRVMYSKSSETTPKSLQFVGMIMDNKLHLSPLTSTQVMRPEINYLDTAETETPKASKKDGVQQATKLGMQFKRQDKSDKAEAFRKSTWAYHSAMEEADTWVPLVTRAPDSNEAKELVDIMTGKAPVHTSGRSTPVPLHILGLDELDASSESEGDNVDIQQGGEDAADSVDTVGIYGYLALISGTGEGVGASARYPYEEVWTGAKLSDIPSILPAGGPAPVSVFDLATEPLAVQVEECLRRAHVLPFSRILEHVPSASSIQEVLAVLEKIGRVVRGNWVLKSDVFFQPNWKTRHSRTKGGPGSRGGRAGRAPSIPPVRAAMIERLAAARDLILLRIMQNADAQVDVEDIMRETNLSRRVIVEIVSRLCNSVTSIEVRRSKLKYVHGIRETASMRNMEPEKFPPLFSLRQPDDADFTSRFPDESDKQTRWWSKRSHEVRDVLSRSLDEESSDEVTVLPSRSRSASIGGADLLAEIDMQILGSSDSSRSPASGMDSRHSDVASSSLSAEGFSEKSQAITHTTLTPVQRHDAAVQVLSKVPKSLYRQVSNMLQDTVKADGVVSMHFLISKVKMAGASSSSAQALLRQVAEDAGCSSADVEAASRGVFPSVGPAVILLELVLETLMSNYAAHVPTKSGLYVHGPQGIREDPYRAAILHLLVSKPSVRKADVQAVVQNVATSIGDAGSANVYELSTTAYNRIMKEFAVSSNGGVWKMKDGGRSTAPPIDINSF